MIHKCEICYTTFDLTRYENQELIQDIACEESSNDLFLELREEDKTFILFARDESTLLRMCAYIHYRYFKLLDRYK